MDEKVQERDIRDLVRIAQCSTEKNGALRRSALTRLIGHSKATSQTLKTFAAQNIRHFFGDFDDLEEVAINSLYDICEDPSSEVRIEGYNAIVQVSRQQSAWVKRNADVLVQLLQSDEPEEVAVVKQALLSHIDMDPTVTLDVLCDQIMLPDNPVDDEEHGTPDRLRPLVLAFLSGEAKPTIVKHLTPAGNACEKVLVSGLISALSKAGTHDTNIIVQDILFALPVFKTSSAKGQELLVALLRRAHATLINKDTTATLSTVQLCVRLVAGQSAAQPGSLVKFLCDHLVRGETLRGFSPEQQLLVVSQVAEVFTVIKAPNVCTQVLRTVHHLFIPMQLSTASKHLAACCTLLSAYVTAQWAPSSLSAGHLGQISKALAARQKTYSSEDKVVVENIQEAIRTLIALPPPVPEASSSRQVPNKLPTGPRSNGVRERSPARDDSSRPTKKAKKGGPGERTDTTNNNNKPPSLLSRLGNGNGNGAFTPPTSSRRNSASTTPSRTNNNAAAVPAPAAGFSIKGAAARQDNGHQASLLERVVPPTGGGGGGSGGNRKRRGGPR